MEIKRDFTTVKYTPLDWLRLIKSSDLNITYSVLVMFIHVRTYVYVAMLLVDTIHKYNTCGSMYLRGKNIRYFIKREARKRPFLHIL